MVIPFWLRPATIFQNYASFSIFILKYLGIIMFFTRGILSRNWSGHDVHVTGTTLVF